MATFTSQVNGNDLYAKRAERTRSGLNLETYNDGTNDVPGILPAGVGTEGNAVLATQQYVWDSIGGVAGAMIFKDVVNGTTKTLPTTGYKAGWTYEVSVAGTYAGETCEVGDMIICVKDFDTTAANSDWAVIQKNVKIVSTYSGTGTDPINGAGVKAAIDTLDAEVTSSDGTNVQVKVTEVDGKVTAVNVTTDNTQAKVSGATSGNFAGLDGNGQVTDSGKKAADFATAAQGDKADSAIQSVKVYNASEAITPDTNKQVVIPAADSSNYGVVTVGTVDLA